MFLVFQKIVILFPWKIWNKNINVTEKMIKHYMKSCTSIALVTQFFLNGYSEISAFASQHRHWDLNIVFCTILIAFRDKSQFYIFFSNKSFSVKLQPIDCKNATLPKISRRKFFEISRGAVLKIPYRTLCVEFVFNRVVRKNFETFKLHLQLFL